MCIKKLSPVFFLLGIIFLCVGLLLGFFSSEAPSLLTGHSEDRKETAERFTEALQAGDLDEASSYLLGQPSLHFAKSEESELTALLWNAYISSLQFQHLEDLALSDSGIYHSVNVSGLDIAALMQQLKEDAPDLLLRESAFYKSDQIIDSDGSYREDFVMTVLSQAAEELLARHDYIATRTLSLELVLQNDRWWIVPTENLLNLICGVDI